MRRPALSSQTRQFLAILGTLTVALYFAIHAWQGAYGLKHLAQLESDEAVLLERSAAVEARLQELKGRIALLSSGAVDPDLLEYEARSQLGFVHEDEVILFVK